jgi:hypothetical protein
MVQTKSFALWKFVRSSTDMLVGDRKISQDFLLFFSPYLPSPGRVEYRYKFAWVNRSPSHIGNQTEVPVGIEYWTND